MTPEYSLRRVAALAGAAALLSMFAHVGAAAAQTPTRLGRTCTAQATAGDTSAECTVTVPAGKRFVIQSATVGGGTVSAQWIQARIMAKVGGGNHMHNVVAGFQVVNNTYTWWSGAVPGTIYGEAGTITLSFSRGGSSGTAWLRMTLTGYLEDM